jgi:HlyD family secretion protein
VSDKSPIFRKVALERLSSPEQLDQLMHVTDARGWIALVALGALLAAGIAWGFVGSLPDTVPGVGILVKSGGLTQAVPTAAGRVADVAVSVGDVVRAGQIVARLEQPELANQLQAARATLATLREQHALLLRAGGQNVALQGEYLERQRAALLQAIEAQERSQKALGEKLEAEEQLVARGLLTRTALLNTRQVLDATREKIADARSQLAALDARGADTRNSAAGSARASQARIDEQEVRVAELERQLAAASQVIAPAGGRVLEVLAERGSVVGVGEPILSLDLEGRAVKDLEAVVYVPSVHGKRIKPGMTIQIAPSTVRQEEFGYMLGRVTYVSDFPATARGMERLLKNGKLVASLSGGDAPYEVRADLVVDPRTVSRYKWSSSGGPPVKIMSGTLASANIAVSTRRPIELVVPFVKQVTGL